MVPRASRVVRETNRMDLTTRYNRGVTTSRFDGVSPRKFGAASIIMSGPADNPDASFSVSGSSVSGSSDVAGP